MVRHDRYSYDKWENGILHNIKRGKRSNQTNKGQIGVLRYIKTDKQS